MEASLKWQRLGSAMTGAFFAALWPAVGLPSAAELTELRAEVGALRDDLAVARLEAEEARAAEIEVPAGERQVDDQLTAMWNGGWSPAAAPFVPQARRRCSSQLIADRMRLPATGSTARCARSTVSKRARTPPSTIRRRSRLTAWSSRAARCGCATMRLPANAHRTPIVLVYALIKRPFVLDMQTGRSVVEYLTRAGFDVYLTDWLPPNPTDTWRGFDAYVNGDLDKAVRFVRAITRSAQVTVLGYCFGALLSLVYTALHPENVRNLVTATTPFDMGVRELPIYNIVERMSEEAMELVTRVHGNCPAWMVQSFFTAMAPAHHAIDKYVGLYRNAERDGYAEQFDLFERWMSSDVAMAGRIFREMSRRHLQAQSACARRVRGRRTQGRGRTNQMSAAQRGRRLRRRGASALEPGSGRSREQPRPAQSDLPDRTRGRDGERCGSQETVASDRRMVGRTIELSKKQKEKGASRRTRKRPKMSLARQSIAEPNAEFVVKF